MFEPETIEITKIDAAKRQLETALELWFADADSVSIHTLAFAAYEIIHRLYRNRGLTDLLYDSFAIAEKDRNEIAKMLKEDAGFFKHADKDPHVKRIFNPGRNLIFLTMAVVGLDRMNEPRTESEEAFMFYLYLHNPSMFPEEVAREQIPPLRLEAMRRQDKSTFLAGYLSTLRAQRKEVSQP